MSKKIFVKVKRQDDQKSASYWEDFEIDYQPNMNVISVLQEIRKKPQNSSGDAVAPVTWDCSCLEEVCGACTMVINGKVKQSCSALVDKLEQPLRLEPMTKFPVVRDLMVDRSKMFEALKRVKAWVEIDGTHNLGAGPRMDEHVRAEAYELSRCMTCGCCLEVCPQYNPNSEFIGAAAISQVRLFNKHPIGVQQKPERLDALMGEGGLDDCGNAQNCVQACPKDIPLTTSIAEMGREVTKHAFKKLLGV